MTASALADELLADPRITGLTLSGGEPMLQARALAETVRNARAQRDLSVVCFTGYTLGDLRERPPADGVDDLLSVVDVLVDGRYVASLNDGRGLRGSSNQRIHHLTGRHVDIADELAGGQRVVEIGTVGRAALLMGVPTLPMLHAFDLAVDRLRASATTSTDGGA